MATYLTEIFEPLAKTDLTGLEDYLEIIKKYITEHGRQPDPIQITTPYLTYDFDRRQLVAHNFSIYTNKTKPKKEDAIPYNKEDQNRYQFKVYINTGNRDFQSMFSSLPSIFIQGCDTFIVHDII